MRKLLISVAAAGAALVAAAPATAQYYGGQPYGYGQGYNGYGYGNRPQLQRELQQIRFQADNLGRQGRLTNREARDLYGDIASAERSLYRADDPRDVWNVQRRITRLRYELRRYADYDYGYGRRDRDDRWGRDDRRDRDDRWDRDDHQERDDGWDGNRR